jgi:hypothetical protein
LCLLSSLLCTQLLVQCLGHRHFSVLIIVMQIFILWVNEPLHQSPSFFLCI